MEQIKEYNFFISSTFNGMEEERNLLMRYVFPSLRAELEPYGIVVRGVDLRWGIPAEPSLPTRIEQCLSEVDNSSPYFIGLVGEDVGTIVKVHLFNLFGILRLGRRFTAIRKLLFQRKSVTELEMAYALSKEGNRNGQLFLIKETSNQNNGSSYIRQVIRKSASPERCHNYILNDFAKIVHDEILNIVFPQGAVRKRLSEQELYEIRQKQISNRLAYNYIPDEAGYQALDSFLNRDSKCLCITGNASCGKSALLANWFRQKEDWNKWKPILHLDSYDTCSPRDAIRLILEELTGHEVQHEEMDYDTIYDQFLSKCNDLPTGQHFLLGLDASRVWGQGIERSRLIAMIEGADKRIKFIITLPDVPKGYDSYRIPDMGEDLITKAITQFVNKNRKEKELKKLLALTANHSIYSFPILSLCLNYLLNYKRFDSIKETVGLLSHLNSQEAIIEHILKSVCRGTDGEIILRETIPLLLESRDGLPEDDLLIISHCPYPEWSQFERLFKNNLLITDSGKIRIRDGFHWSKISLAGLSPTECQERIISFYSNRTVDSSFSTQELAYQYFQKADYHSLYNLLINLDRFLDLYHADKASLDFYWKSALFRQGYSMKAFVDYPDLSPAILNSLGNFIIRNCHSSSKSDAFLFLNKALENDSISLETRIKVYGNIASIYGSANQVEKSIASYKQCLAYAEQSANSDFSTYWEALIHLRTGGFYYNWRYDPDIIKARKLVQRALTEYYEAEKILTPSPRFSYLYYCTFFKIANAIEDLTTGNHPKPDLDGAVEYYTRIAVEIGEKYYGPNSHELRFAYNSRGRYFAEYDCNFSTALEYYRKAEAISDMVGDLDCLATVKGNISRCLRSLDKCLEADKYARDYYSLRLKLYGSNDPRTQRALMELSS